METVLLTTGDLEEILTQDEVNKAVERGFEAHGQDRVQMPPKNYVDLQRYNGDMRSMPCYVEEPEALSVKWVNVHPDNPQKGLSTVMATIINSDPATGTPKAVMDGTLITDMRTGAAGAVSCKYLANPRLKGGRNYRHRSPGQDPAIRDKTGARHRRGEGVEHRPGLQQAIRRGGGVQRS